MSETFKLIAFLARLQFARKKFYHRIISLVSIILKVLSLRALSIDNNKSPESSTTKLSAFPLFLTFHFALTRKKMIQRSTFFHKFVQIEYFCAHVTHYNNNLSNSNRFYRLLYIKAQFQSGDNYLFSNSKFKFSLMLFSRKIFAVIFLTNLNF